MTRRRRWWIAGSIGAILFLAVGAVAFWVAKVVEANRLDRATALVKTLIDEAKARPGERPVLRGEPLPGNAWDDYRLALAEAERLQDASETLGDFLSEEPTVDRKTADAAAARTGAAIAHMQAGLRKGSAKHDCGWSRGLTYETAVSGGVTIARFAAFRAKVLMENGKAAEAAELMLDTALFARDMGWNGVLIEDLVGVVMASIALDELRSALPKLTAPQSEAVARELAIIDACSPDSATPFLNELAWEGAVILSVDQFLPPKARLRWDDRLFLQLLQANAIFELEAGLRRTADACGKPWPEAQRILAGVKETVWATRNPLTALIAPAVESAQRSQRQRQAQLRLLRIAAHWRATGEVLDLDDPFGTKLRHAKTDAGLKAWSVGPDGEDDAGQGTWDLYPSEELDLVFDVPR